MEFEKINQNLLGADVEMSEFTAQQLYTYIEICNTMNAAAQLDRRVMMINCWVINQSLAQWFKKFNPIKRFFLKRKFSVKKLSKNLSVSQVNELSEKIYILNGLLQKDKKKVGQEKE